MAERRLLMLESYYDNSGKGMFRLTNSPGLPFYEDLKRYILYGPTECKPAVIDEVTKVVLLLSSSCEKW
jgi:hypothetical protein